MQVREAEVSTLWIYGAVAAILLCYVWFLLLDAGTAQKLSHEDGIVEYLAAFSLVAACLFLACYLRSARHANSLFGSRARPISTIFG